MYCARCQRNFGLFDPITWAVLPGSTNPVPTCYDDRLCQFRQKMYKPIPRVKAHAMRFVGGAL